MVSPSRSAAPWRRGSEFEFSFDGTAQVRYCVHAKHFAAWTRELVAQATKAPSDISINIAKLHLLQKYWEWYVSIPQAHQNHIGNRDHHVCIFQVFKEAFFTLHTISLSLTPPRLFEPPLPPSPPPPPMIAGVFIGEEGEAEEDADGQ